MDEQLNGRLMAIRFALGKLIRESTNDREARQDKIEQMRDFADSLLQDARANSPNAPSLTFDQQAYLSGLNDEFDRLIDIIDSPPFQGNRA